MASREANSTPPVVHFRTPHSQLLQQVLPLVEDLPGGCQQRLNTPNRTDFPSVERVTPHRCLIMNGSEIRIDCVSGTSMREKSRQLRVVSVAASLTTQHGSCQQGLAPQCNQALRIEVTRMDRPEAHANVYSTRLLGQPYPSHAAANKTHGRLCDQGAVQGASTAYCRGCPECALAMRAGAPDETLAAQVRPATDHQGGQSPDARPVDPGGAARQPTSRSHRGVLPPAGPAHAPSGGDHRRGSTAPRAPRGGRWRP